MGAIGKASFMTGWCCKGQNCEHVHVMHLYVQLNEIKFIIIIDIFK